MEAQVDRLTIKAWSKFLATPPSQRLLIAISGIPGSGKTTLAATIVQRLNALYFADSNGGSSAAPIASFIPMDGYHLTRAQLSAMPSPSHAHARRGAAFTFDAPAFLSLVQSVRVPLDPSSPILYAPSFDHALKDPVPSDLPIHPFTRIVVFEGLYLSLNTEPWRTAGALMDELWFVEVDFQTARKRLVPRHVRAGIAKDEEEAGRRADENDLVNGEEIVRQRVEVHEVVISKDDEEWEREGRE